MVSLSSSLCIILGIASQNKNFWRKKDILRLPGETWTKKDITEIFRTIRHLTNFMYLQRHLKRLQKKFQPKGKTFLSLSIDNLAIFKHVFHVI